MLNAIERGTFDYYATFPNSRHTRQQHREQAAREARGQPLGQLLDAYLAAMRAARALSPSSIATYARWAEARLRPRWGATPIDEVTPADLRAWVADLAGELSPKSVRNCVTLMSGVLDQAVEDGLLTTNPLDNIKLRKLIPRRRKSDDEDRIDPFNDAEVAAILAAADRPEERALYQFAFASGLRTGELIALKWAHVDWLQGYVHVVDNVVDAEVGTKEQDTKTGNTRDIPMLPAARTALEAMRAISQLASGYVFLNSDRRRWSSSQQIRDRWEIVLRRAGVRYRNPYQTRHTFASRLLMAGEPELLVAHLLGHESVEMVRRHYGKYIRQPDGVQLKGDYSSFGTDPAVSRRTHSG